VAETVADTVYVDPGSGTTPLVALIASARHTIDGEVYLLSSRPVLAALEGAAARGVTVQIALEQHPDGGGALPKTAYSALAGHKVQVRWTNPAFRFTHAKYLVVDDTSAWIGTMNWTTSAFVRNREFGIRDTDPAVVRQAEAVFTADWAHQPFSGKASALVLSPVNARGDIDGLISGARRTLDVYAEEVADSRQEQLLIAAAKRGVKVRVVCTGDGDISALRAGGVLVVVKRSPYIHAKAFIADGSVMYSENISTTSLDHNREMGLILHDSAAVSAVERVFAQDVGGAAPVTGPSAGRPKAGPTAAVGGALVVRVTVTPPSMPYSAYPTLTAYTTTGATCTASVVYSTGRSPVSFSGTAETVGAGGSVSWSWHEETKGSGGTATVRCTLKGQSAQAQAAFTVTG
jgi:phosphatidylserine/phosphatidylglycerophosphate/cardiolipin synthase-like enzyme